MDKFASMMATLITTNPYRSTMLPHTAEADHLILSYCRISGSSKVRNAAWRYVLSKQRIRHAQRNEEPRGHLISITQPELHPLLPDDPENLGLKQSHFFPKTGSADDLLTIPV